MDFEDEHFSKMRINTERVIRAVEKHPCLWNNKHPDYRDRERKQDAWQEVAQMVIHNCTNLSEFERSNAERYVRARWRTARDAYNKSKNMLSNPKKARQYAYADRMKFLEGCHGTSKKNNGHLHLETIKQEDNTLSGEDNELSNDSINITVEPNLLEEDDPFSETAVRPESSCSFMSGTKQKSDQNDDVDTRRMFGVVSEVTEMFKNDDLAFFVSLLPMVSDFGIDEKLSLRSKILETVAEMRKAKQEAK
ncbi:unnamed protein product [Callosobruchus maculatus]|uniref:Uncharacterized protein n=1 Tax=Callosobruchus maculatus TaxID=64391 RepID=A0A653D266_CALMS|nr:unnamed protein product [Callosobruchus maculatus]